MVQHSFPPAHVQPLAEGTDREVVRLSAAANTADHAATDDIAHEPSTRSAESFRWPDRRSSAESAALG